VSAAGLELRVLATPGHSSDSLCFVLEDAVLTGDTVLGRGTTVIAHPDGRLGDYWVRCAGWPSCPTGSPCCPATVRSWPTPAWWPGSTWRTASSASRRSGRRMEQLGPDATPRQVVEVVYADVDPVLWGAAEFSVRAQLDYLRS